MPNIYQTFIVVSLYVGLTASQSFNPSILQDTRDEPKVDGTFGFLYRTEDGIAHAAKGNSDGVISGRFSYTDPTGLKVNYNYNAGSRVAPGYNYNDPAPVPSRYSNAEPEYRQPEPQYNEPPQQYREPPQQYREPPQQYRTPPPQNRGPPPQQIQQYRRPQPEYREPTENYQPRRPRPPVKQNDVYDDDYYRGRY